MEYELIRSERRTLSIEIKQGRIIVRAPMRTSKAEINSFVLKNKDWIDKKLAESLERRREADECPKLSPEQIQALAKKALEVIPKRVEYYAPLVGVSYGRITIRNQRTKWGSCSSKGNLNFNCLLMLAPPEVLDSVVVHELCHRKEMNHSEQFYSEVLRVFPQYKEAQKWLKENGARLMAMMDR